MKKAIIAIQLLLICASFSAEPRDETSIAGIEVAGGSGTAQDYLKLSANEKTAYATGQINGMLLAPFFGAPRERQRWFTDYMSGMNSPQVAEIITKFLNDNPGKWHEPLNVLTYLAIQDAYKKVYPQGR
jgi:hypothetical protein